MGIKQGDDEVRELRAQLQVSLCIFSSAPMVLHYATTHLTTVVLLSCS